MKKKKGSDKGNKGSFFSSHRRDFWFLFLVAVGLYIIYTQVYFSDSEEKRVQASEGLDQKTLIVRECDNNPTRAFGWGNKNVATGVEPDLGCFDNGGNKIKGVTSDRQCAFLACQM
ncbi:MAG: hypothetical protein FJY91_01905 [Candidatus Harrisonbacteria bacterium]|nr:hypothetical protein [Candidatus Harrisonbacteria bacterium]